MSEFDDEIKEWKPSLPDRLAGRIVEYLDLVKERGQGYDRDDIEMILKETLSEPECKWLNAERRLALGDRSKILVKSRVTAKDRAELDRLEKLIGHIPTGYSRIEIEAQHIIQRAAKRLREQEN